MGQVRDKVGRRVVVTGLGAVTPLGLDMESTWRNALAGRSGIGPLTACPADGLDSRIAGEVRGFDAAHTIGVKEARRLDRAVQLGLAAAIEAVAHSGAKVSGPDTAVVMGTSMAGLVTLSQQMLILDARGPGRVSVHLVPMMIPNMLTSQVAIWLKAQGPCFGASAACASGAQAIVHAAEMIRNGTVRVAVAGGAEAPVTRIGIAGLSRMGALSRRNDEPERASRPFDSGRDGFVLSEGAAALVLEELGSALERGANILAEIVGWGVTCDAYHVTHPLSSGDQVARAMTLAMMSARLRPEDVDYINTHATATVVGDPTEARAIRSALGEATERVAVSSTKSMTGHLVGASGALEAAFCVLAIRDGAIPPTINLDEPDPECQLNHVVNVARRQPVKATLSNSFGFGGHNVVLAIAAPQEM